MRIKREGNGVNSVLLGALNTGFNHSGVPAMHPIKVADGDNGTLVSGNLRQVGPDFQRGA